MNGTRITNHESLTKPPRRLSGFDEWAPHRINIQRGCEHGCLYCYAHTEDVRRFRRCTSAEWLVPVINNKKVDCRRKKLDGVVGFPSRHDITPLNINQYLCVLRKLLDAGNKVLITTKPHLECIKPLCEAYIEYREQITFRFTIGSTADAVLGFWEPGAPKFEERLDCLKYAYSAGFITSVSCEPYLDGFPTLVYEAVRDFICESFWLGKLRNFESRVRLDGVSEEQKQRFVEPLKKLQSDSFVLAVVDCLKNKPLVRFKDSVQAVLEKHGSNI